jgi:hypothetical protein
MLHEDFGDVLQLRQSVLKKCREEGSVMRTFFDRVALR